MRAATANTTSYRIDSIMGWAYEKWVYTNPIDFCNAILEKFQNEGFNYKKWNDLPEDIKNKANRVPLTLHQINAYSVQFKDPINGEWQSA